MRISFALCKNKCHENVFQSVLQAALSSAKHRLMIKNSEKDIFRLEKFSVLYYNIFTENFIERGGIPLATWIVHLRIADVLIKNNIIPARFKREFILGSVAPDCGYGKKDSLGDFSPPPEITHWAPGGVKIHCRYNSFLNEYLKGDKSCADYYFYLGYYIHLITDVIWSATMYLPTKIKYAAEYEANPDFLKTIKKDWYDLDFKFLSENPDFEPYQILKSNTSVDDYLPYYEENQLTVQTKFIADYYSSSEEHAFLREYTYLTENDMTNFINSSIEIISMDIKRKQLI